MSDTGTRRPTKAPREAIEIIARLWGVEVIESVNDPELPEARLHLAMPPVEGSFDHVSEVKAIPRLNFKGTVPVIEIEVTVGGWAAIAAHSPQDAVIAARVHMASADAAILAQSVANGRRWDPEKILNKKGGS